MIDQNLEIRQESGYLLLYSLTEKQLEERVISPCFKIEDPVIITLYNRTVSKHLYPSINFKTFDIG